jgi:hypothetical protein
VSALQKLRKELIATRIAAFGLFLVVVLSLYGSSRVVFLSAFFVVALVASFLGFRWGLGDTELRLRDSIGATVAVALVILLLLIWGRTR